MEYLQSLGSTPDEVAEKLKAEGVKAVTLACSYCAVVVGIHLNCPETWSQFITSPRSGVISYGDCQVTDPRLPEPVAEFIRRFDQRMYPELIHSDRERCVLDMEILKAQRKLDELKNTQTKKEREGK